MYIRFHIGRSGHSRFGIRRVPAYCLRDWDLDFADAERIVCRPTLETAGRRMQWSLACLILLVIVFWEYGVPSHTFAWIAVWGLLALAVLPLVLVPIHRVTLMRGPDRELVVSVRSLWPSRRRFPLRSVHGILVGPDEEVSRRRRVRVHHGWRWLVKLVGTTEPKTAADTAHEFDVQFFVDFQKEKPEDPARPPRRVQSFAQRLSELSGGVEISYAIPGERFGQPGRFGWPLERKTVVATSEPETETHTFRTLDEVPPPLRDDFERLMEESHRTGRREIRTIRVTVRDSSGKEITYNSLDEMPPDVRARYEQILRQAPPRRKSDDR